MNRKDYELIARCIAATRVIPGVDSATLSAFIEILSAELADDNPRFNDEKFRKATY